MASSSSKRRATVRGVAMFSRRLPHVITRSDLSRALAPTYAKAAQVDAEEAEDRLLRAFANQRILDEVYAGLSAALAGKITFKNGQVEQSNFHDYPVIRLNEAPVVETHIIDSGAKMGGVGEPGTPPIAPAGNKS